MGNDGVYNTNDARLDSTNPVAGGQPPDEWATERALGSSRQVKPIAVSDQLGTGAPSVAPSAGALRHVATVVTVTATAVLLWSASVTATSPVASVVTVGALLPAVVADIYTQRLPNALVGVAAITLTGALTIETIGGAEWPATSVAAGLAAATAPMLVLHLVSPGAMGFGDVKTAAVLGAAMGVADWRLALAMLALAAGGAVIVATIARLRSIPFGPPLVVAAAAVLAAQPDVLGVLGP